MIQLSAVRTALNSSLLKYMYEHNSHHMSELSELETKYGRMGVICRDTKNK